MFHSAAACLGMQVHQVKERPQRDSPGPPETAFPGQRGLSKL